MSGLLLSRIGSGDWESLSALYAEDAVVELPFEPRRLEGKAALRERFDLGASRGWELEARDVVVHETTDPEVVVVEWDYHGVVTATGATFVASNVQVLRVRDGLIVWSRDYHDHRALAAAR